MRQAVFSILIAIGVTGCTARHVEVTYDTQSAGSQGWYPIPADAPEKVSSATLTVPRAQIDLQRPEPEAIGAPLQVERLVDSIGNTSLRLNRSTSATWELVSSALASENIVVEDRDRDQYRFDLLKEHKGLFGLFKEDQDALAVVLVPDNDKTLIVLEGKDDATPDSQYSADVVDTLYRYFKTDR